MSFSTPVIIHTILSRHPFRVRIADPFLSPRSHAIGNSRIQLYSLMQVGRGRRLTGRCRLLLPPQPLHSHQRHGFTSLIPPPHAHSFHYTTLRPPSPPHPHPSRLCVHLPGLGWRRRRRLGRLGPSSTPSPSQPLLIVACYCDMREYSICVRLMQMQPLASWSRGRQLRPDLTLLYSCASCWWCRMQAVWSLWRLGEGGDHGRDGRMGVDWDRRAHVYGSLHCTTIQ